MGIPAFLTHTTASAAEDLCNVNFHFLPPSVRRPQPPGSLHSGKQNTAPDQTVAQSSPAVAFPFLLLLLLAPSWSKNGGSQQVGASHCCWVVLTPNPVQNKWKQN